MSNNEEQFELLKCRNNAVNLINQSRIVNEERYERDPIQNLEGGISEVASTMYSALCRSSKSSIAPDLAEQRLEKFQSSLLEEIHENELPVQCLYVDDLRQGDKHVLAQNVVLMLGISHNNNAMFVKFEAGSTIEILNNPASELQIKNGSTSLWIDSEHFPSSGMFVRTDTSEDYSAIGST